MKLFSIFLVLFCFIDYSFSQVTLNADGPGDTYELISSVMAPGYYPIEVPDCNHEAFGEHIDEIFDDELNEYVFRFHIHTSSDNDRCINFDRQRNEIKSYDKSPDNLLGIEDEEVVYKWKFKLAEGFQSSPNFTHIHQLKSVGGSLASMPMYTLTTRKSSPDRLELRYAETDDQITLAKTDLEPLIGAWLSVTETIVYGTNGSYEIEISRVNDDEVLFSYSDDQIVNWRPGADFVRPKWGIYRSLDNAQDLRDEEVLFANFSIDEKDPLSSLDLKDDEVEVILNNPVSNIMSINSGNTDINSVSVFNLDGNRILYEQFTAKSEFDVDISSLMSGAYILQLKGEDFSYSRKIIVL